MSLWDDALNDPHFGEVEPDPAVDSLLSMAPQNVSARATFEPMLRALFSNIRQQIGEPAYQKFCADLQTAALRYAQGDKEGAREFLAQYGLDITQMELMVGIS